MVAASVSRLPSPAAPELDEVVAIYFDRVDLAASTRRKYEHTLGALIAAHGGTPIGELGPDELTTLLEELAGEATGQTWNRHRAALGSLWSYAERRGWAAAGLVRQVERRKATKTARGEQRQRTVPLELLEKLWGNRGAGHQVHPLRDRALWRLAYDTAARTEELLNLDVGDLDLDDRSAPVVGKGGDVRRVRWGTGTNRLLRELAGERTSGPLFVTDRKASRDVARADLAPDGRARLSYGRAHEIFAAATDGTWTLHQLRHTRLSHLADRGVPPHLLQQISGHKSLRSLAGYLHGSEDAVRAIYDGEDDARRRRDPAS